jgi:acyl-coenzyme A thioesterase PaaI-like protein
MELPRLSFGKIEKYDMCFGCGQANQHGLKMKFSQDNDGTATGEFTPNESHQGWPGYVHGGILMAALDEGIGWACQLKEIHTVTAKIDIRLKSMARIGETLTISGSIKRQTTRLLEVEAKATRKDGSLVAEASSVQFIMKPEKPEFSGPS